MKKSNEKIQDLSAYSRSEMLRALDRALKAKDPRKQQLLRDYQALWAAIVSILEHIDSETYKSVR